MYPHKVVFYYCITIYSSFNCRETKMSWDEQNTKILRKLWSQGLTASQISIQIPGKSRNAIIGRANRLNLESRVVSKKTSTTLISKKGDNVAIKQEEKLSRKARFRALLLDKNFEPEKPKKLEELTDDTCRWPNHHPFEEKFYFCGRKPMEKFSYCRLHVLYAFQPRNAKEEDQITEDDIPQFIEKKIKSS